MRPLICYDYGDMCEEITGGWAGNGSAQADHLYINVNYSSTEDRRSSRFTLQAVDVTPYRTLEVVISNDSSNNWDGQSLGLYSSRNYSSRVAGPSVGNNAHTMETMYADISHLSGVFYGGMSVYVSKSSSSGNWLRLYSFRLIR